jgi:hypothetical protein
MSRSPGPDLSNEPAHPEAEPGRGLADPRTIHPSPEGLFPDSVESLKSVTPSEPDPQPPGEDLAPEEGVRGMVDPKNKPAGPVI